jgi:hypothetical protein
MSNFVTIREGIGGEFRAVAINLSAVNEIRNESDGTATFAFPDGNTTVSIFDDALRAALAAHGIVFAENDPVAKAA